MKVSYINIETAIKKMEEIHQQVDLAMNLKKKCMIIS